MAAACGGAMAAAPVSHFSVVSLPHRTTSRACQSASAHADASSGLTGPKRYGRASAGAGGAGGAGARDA
eukprot:410446-Prymnesium_polylepis.2